MEKRFIVATILLVGVVLFFTGGFISENCVDISGCKKCWKTTQAVMSEPLLCGGNSSCLAQPQDQQNNAIVDAVFCACTGARDGAYGNEQLNRKIESVVSTFAGYNLTVNQICDQPGTFLSKVSYV